MVARRLGLGIAVLVGVVVAASAGARILRPHSVISADAAGLRTYTEDRSADFVCVIDTPSQLVGTLDGDAAQRDPVWLRDDAGRRLAVVWPEGFSVAFEPGAALYDENGQRIAHQGDSLRIEYWNSVPLGPSIGSFEDPYIAKVVPGSRCYFYSR